VSDDVREALTLQATACRSLGSLQYAELLEHLILDHDRGGLVRELLAGRSQRPTHDALPLRLLAAAHRLALRGEASALAARFPSCGGDGAPVDPTIFLDTVRNHRAEIESALGEQVQTNEPRRSVALVATARWLATRDVAEFDLLEIGASAGLNQNFDRLGHQPPGDGAAARCVERRGCDPYPLNPADDDDALRLLSFVWPDQTERFDRLRAAIETARRWPPTIDNDSADDFLRRRLATSAPRARVIFHSIVWQYLAQPVRRGLREALGERGAAATPHRPLAWIRMEPAGAVAEIQATVWRGDEEPEQHRLGDVGFHGQQLHWRPERVVDHVSSRPWGA